MRAAPIRALGDVGFSDAAKVGGKAASLGDLIAHGVRVPDGLVMGVDATVLGPAERASLIRAAAATLGAGPFAVRSSGVTEDGIDRSFAGLYDSILGVPLDDLPVAVERCLASASGGRVGTYASGEDVAMGVIVQRMVAPLAAGVAMTADPVSGDRGTSVVTAVGGLADRLVSGEAAGDEWLVTARRATPRRLGEHAIDRRDAERIAAEARRIAALRGMPQDVEWALDAEGVLWIVQARPITALPPDVSWEPPAGGAFTRNLRLGEWISEPVTPLFESWLLPAMEERMHERLGAWTGQRAPRPHHVVVNGWYFYSLNWFSGRAFARSFPTYLIQIVRAPRRVAGIIPPTVRHSVPVFERDWREDLRPRYRAAVAAAEERVDHAAVEDLPALIDELADLAGEYFASIAALGGAAYKLEMTLARFWRRHLRVAGESHQPLLAGLTAPAGPASHAVTSLDWWERPIASDAPSSPAVDHPRLVEARLAAERAALRTLDGSPRRLRAFWRLLADAQRTAPIREEQMRELTIAWPVMRRAVVRIGKALSDRGVIDDPDDVFFLRRDEALTGLAASGTPDRVDTSARRAERAIQSRLVPPLEIGSMNPMLRAVWASFPRMLGAERSAAAVVWGSPASPGRATGPVRVIRGPGSFDELLPGEVLVAPLTAPGWTPLFTRAAAVVTDIGSAAAHASIIAREYGIPSVVGCGDATSRLRTGMWVTVDGSTGNVERAVAPPAR